MSIFQILADNWRLAFPLVAFASCYVVEPASTISKQYTRTVPVEVICADGSQVGTGVLYRTGEVYSANHVFQCDTGEPLAVLVDDSPAVPLQASKAFDLTTLHWPASPHAAPLVIGDKPTVGEQVCHTAAAPVVGRHCGEVLPYREGRQAGNIQHTAITDHGNSGGPLWNTSGELVGITTHLTMCTNGQICGGRATSFVGFPGFGE